MTRNRSTHSPTDPSANLQSSKSANWLALQTARKTKHPVTYTLQNGSGFSPMEIDNLPLTSVTTGQVHHTYRRVQQSSAYIYIVSALTLATQSIPFLTVLIILESWFSDVLLLDICTSCASVSMAANKSLILQLCVNYNLRVERTLQNVWYRMI